MTGKRHKPETTKQTAGTQPDAASFESSLQRDEQYVLRLYIAGMSTRSAEAVRTVQKICSEHLEGRFDLEVIDIYQSPELAKEAQIIAAPSLVKQLPLPLRKLIGNLSDRERVLVGLALLTTPDGERR